MKKFFKIKFVLSIMIMSIFISSCGNKVTPFITENSKNEGIFSPGMSADNFFEVAKNNNIEIPETPEIQNFDDYETKRYYSDDFIFIINPDDVLSVVSIRNENISTAKGLKIGDTSEQMFKEYGKPYKYLTISEYVIYLYQLENEYVLFTTNDTSKVIEVISYTIDYESPDSLIGWVDYE